MNKLFLIAAFFSFLSCGNNGNNRVSAVQFMQSNKVMDDGSNTNIEELDSLITVPEKITDVKWQTIRTGTGELGPSDIILLAVLSIPDSTILNKLQSETTLDYQVGIKNTLIRNWIPNEIKVLFIPHEKQKDILVPTVEAFDPSLFINKELRQGFFIIDEEQKKVFLYLISM
jgi:hypothetical protein